MTLSKNNTAENNGGGIYLKQNGYAKATITNSTIEYNEADQGGGIYIETDGNNGECTITGCNINYNGYASNKVKIGGGIWSKIPLTIKGSTISYNKASSSGGGIYSDAKLTIQENGTTKSYINYNSATNNNNSGNGGGIFSIKPLKLSGTIINNNTTNKNGGGIFQSYSNDDDTHTAFTNLEIYNNSTDNTSENSRGGGIALSFNPKSKITFTSCSIYGNTSYYGGGIYFSSTNLSSSDVNILFNSCTIGNSTHPNNAANGGGIAINNFYNVNLKLESSVIGDSSKTTYATSTSCANSASSFGGGIYIFTDSNATFDIDSSSSIAYNYATNGGGIYISSNNKSLIIQNGTIKNNTASLGSAIYSYKTITKLNKNTISNNFATHSTDKSSIYASDQNLEIGNVNITNGGSTTYPGIYMANTTSTRRTLKLSGKIINCPEIYLGNGNGNAIAYLIDTIETRNNKKLSINYNLTDSPVSLQLFINTPTPITTSNYINNNNLYELYNTGYVYKKTSTSPSATKKIQDCIDEQETANINPVIINFTQDYTENSGQISNNSYSNSPCVTHKENFTYYFYGNGKTYNANRNSSKKGTAMYIDGGNVIIDNLTVKGGYSTSSAGGIFVNENSTLTLQNKTIIGDTTSTTATSTDYANYSSFGGGGLYIGGKVIITDSDVKISYNYSNGCGGGVSILNTGDLEIKSTTSSIQYNYSTSNGGGIFCSNGKLLFQGSCSSNKSAAAPGICIIGESKFTASGSNFNNNNTTNTSSKIGLGIQFGNSASSYNVTSYTNDPNTNMCQNITFNYSLSVIPSNCADIVCYQNDTACYLYGSQSCFRNMIYGSTIYNIGRQTRYENNGSTTFSWTILTYNNYQVWTLFPNDVTW